MSSDRIRFLIDNYFTEKFREFKLPYLYGFTEMLLRKRNLSDDSKSLLHDVAGRTEQLTNLIIENKLFINCISGFKVSVRERTYRGMEFELDSKEVDW